MKYVCKTFGILDSPLLFVQIFSTVCLQNWALFEPSLPSVRTRMYLIEAASRITHAFHGSRLFSPNALSLLRLNRRCFQRRNEAEDELWSNDSFELEIGKRESIPQLLTPSSSSHTSPFLRNHNIMSPRPREARD